MMFTGLTILRPLIDYKHIEFLSRMILNFNAYMYYTIYRCKNYLLALEFDFADFIAFFYGCSQMDNTLKPHYHTDTGTIQKMFDKVEQ